MDEGLQEARRDEQGLASTRLQLKNAVKSYVRKELWPAVKFLSEQDKRCNSVVARKVLKKALRKDPAAQEDECIAMWDEWVGTTVVKALHEKRNSVAQSIQNSLKKGSNERSKALEALEEGRTEPFTVEEMSEILESKRENKEAYAWLFQDGLKYVVGKSQWKQKVESGAHAPAKVASKTDEAILLLMLENYYEAWHAKHNNTHQGQSLPEAKYTTRGPNKLSWSREGLRRFNEIVGEVEESRSSEEGKEFEREFQEEMQKRNGGRKRKRRREEEDEEERVQPYHDEFASDEE